eukprot:scaffold14038_cov110-Isochrysis_galbana.AAC.5
MIDAMTESRESLGHRVERQRDVAHLVDSRRDRTWSNGATVGSDGTARFSLEADGGRSTDTPLSAGGTD